MKRLSFLVNQGENDCLMAHGLDWAVYAEAESWEKLADNIRDSVRREFSESERPLHLDFVFMDGRVITLAA